MKLKFTFLFAKIFTSLLLIAQNPPQTYEWIKNVAFNPSGEVIINQLDIAADGSIYVGGMTDLGDAIFANGDTITDNTLPFRRDGFLAKYDALGNVVWTKEFDQGGQFGLGGLEVDLNENLYLAGRNEDSMLIDGVPVPDRTFYWFKYDSTGNRLAHHLFTATAGNHFAYVDMATDNAGNCYISGLYNGSITIDGTTYNAAQGRAIVIKVDANNQVDWVFQTASGYASDLAIAQNGNLLYSGFGAPGSSFGSFTCGGSGNNSNAILAELDTANGNVLWFANPNCSRGSGFGPLYVDASGDIYVGGAFGRDMQVFNLNQLTIGNFTLNPIPNPNISLFGMETGLLAKYDAQGNVVWAKAQGYRPNVNRYIMNLLGKQDTVYVVGQMRDSLKFYTATDSLWVSGLEAQNAFIAKMDTAGNYISARATNLFLSDFFDTETDSQGDLFFAGNFDEDYRFGYNSVLNNTGRNDSYIAKLNSLDTFSLPAPQNLRVIGKGPITSVSYYSDVAWDDINGEFGYRIEGTSFMGPAINIITDTIDDTSERVPMGLQGTVYELTVAAHLYDMPFAKSMVLVDTAAPSLATTLAEIQNKNQVIELYPNPSKGQLNVSANERIHQLTIVDLSGKVVLEQMPAQRNFQLNLADLPKGVYLMRINTNKAINIQRIVLY